MPACHDCGEPTDVLVERRWRDERHRLHTQQVCAECAAEIDRELLGMESV